MLKISCKKKKLYNNTLLLEILQYKNCYVILRSILRFNLSKKIIRGITLPVYVHAFIFTAVMNK